MNYYQARELQKDGKGIGLWHYTCMNDHRIWAVGHCSSWEVCPDCKETHAPGVRHDPPHCARCKDEGILKKENPCPGHKTPEEAEEHYRQYLIDSAEIRGPKKEEWPKEKCDVKGCNEEAKYLGIVTGRMMDKQLCEKHANKETMAILIERPGWICCS
jgi:hypothetical protein